MTNQATPSTLSAEWLPIEPGLRDGEAMTVASDFSASATREPSWLQLGWGAAQSYADRLNLLLAQNVPLSVAVVAAAVQLITQRSASAPANPSFFDGEQVISLESSTFDDERDASTRRDLILTYVDQRCTIGVKV